MNNTDNKEIMVSPLTAEELRQITKEYTEKLAAIFFDFFQETNFMIANVETVNMYHLSTVDQLPTELLISIQPARSYYTTVNKDQIDTKGTT